MYVRSMKMLFPSNDASQLFEVGIPCPNRNRPLNDCESCILVPVASSPSSTHQICPDHEICRAVW